MGTVLLHGVFPPAAPASAPVAVAVVISCLTRLTINRGINLAAEDHATVGHRLDASSNRT